MRRLNKKYRRLMRRIRKEQGGQVFNEYHRLKMETENFLRDFEKDLDTIEEE